MSIITVTGGIACDVDVIAELVAGQLNLTLLDDDKLLEEAERMGLSSMDGLESLKEKHQGLIKRLLMNKAETYLYMMEAVIFEAVRGGNAVLPGHGSQMILKEFESVLHVRLFASEESRRRKLSDLQKITVEEAGKLIHKSDSQKRRFILNSFNRDWNDINLYDLVINRDKIDIDAAVRLITEAAETEKIKAGLVNFDEFLEKKALVKLIESSLLKESITPRFLIEAIEKDKVRISGIIDSDFSLNRIIKIVKNVPGVSEVINDITVFRESTV